MSKRIGKYKVTKRDSANSLVDGGTATGAIINASRTITSGGDAVDATGINVLLVDKSGGNVTIGGFTGGVAGQVLHVVAIAAANDLIIENAEGGGNQDILLGNADITYDAVPGGLTLVCTGTNWTAIQAHDLS